MRDDLLNYYEQELTFLRRMGAEFAEKYPGVASQLLLEPNKCEDPHVERLLEGFAFLAARVHLKVDDDFSEISEALLQIVYPNYVRPIPAMCLVEFQLDPEQGKLTTGLHVPRESLLYTRPVKGAACKFRTCYDTTLWPLTVAAAEWKTPDQLQPPVKAPQALAAIRLDLQCLADVTFESLELDTLRLHLNGESHGISTLYELLCNNCVGILIRDPNDTSKAPVSLPATAVTPVGFGEDEGLLPFPRRSFQGYRWLQEYFVFPEKFHFIDLTGFSQVRAAGFGDRAEVIFLISAFEQGDRRQMLETGVTRQTFRLGCTPIVNLFPQTSEPILVSQRTYEYPVVPDARRRETTGVFSIDDVVAVSPGSTEPLHFEPFYSYRHGEGSGEKNLFWYSKRRESGWRSDEGTDVYLTFVDLSARSVHPEADAVTARLTCYNGDLPSQLQFGTPEDFSLQGGGPITGITALVNPTRVIQPPLGKPQLWRLISQLSLNYMSLVSGGPDALRELFRLNNFSESASAEKQIQGIMDIRSAPCFSRIENEHGLSFARGHRVEVDFDEEQFAGGGVYLFASLLERFLGLYVSMNSFCILAARTAQRKELLREWPPRAGSKTLL